MLRHERISAHPQRIYDPLGVALYLCEGTERAALMDTGYGIKGLRAFVEGLTDKPVTVLLTHGHLDHVPGAFEWDEAYLNERDAEVFEAHVDEDYRLRVMRDFFPQVGIARQDLAPRGDFRLQPLRDGDAFDLGGITLEAYAMPGHSPGSMVFLFPEDRIALFGDAVGPGTLMIEDFSTSVSEYLAAMRAFQKAHAGRYNRVLRNHGTCESTPAVLDDAIEVAERILAGTDAQMELPPAVVDLFPHGNPEGIPRYSGCELVPSATGMVRPDGREGNINYRQDKAR